MLQYRLSALRPFRANLSEDIIQTAIGAAHKSRSVQLSVPSSANTFMVCRKARVSRGLTRARWRQV
jgi:hypothetical protein